MFHELIRVWFGWVEAWGYGGIFLLMALESTFVPVPSEIVIPPAAFWAAQGRMSFTGVILAGTLGGYVGSILNYWISRKVGQPILHRYGRYVLISHAKMEMGHRWISQFGVPGVFAARLLPVVRHLISIPAGILEMPVLRFSAATILGAGLWCSVLAWFGSQAIGNNPELLQSPEAMAHVIKARMAWFVGAVAVFVLLYGLVIVLKRRHAGVPALGESPSS